MLDSLPLALPSQQRSRGHELGSGQVIESVDPGSVGSIALVFAGAITTATQMTGDIPSGIFSAADAIRLLNICVGVVVVYSIKRGWDKLLSLFDRVTALEMRMHDVDKLGPIKREDGRRDTD